MHRICHQTEHLAFFYVESLESSNMRGLVYLYAVNTYLFAAFSRKVTRYQQKANPQNIGTLYFDILKLSQFILLILLIHLSLPEAKTHQNWVQESSSTAPAEFSSRSVRPFTKKRVQKIYKTQKHQQQRQKSLDFRYFFGLIVA